MEECKQMGDSRKVECVLIVVTSCVSGVWRLAITA